MERRQLEYFLAVVEHGGFTNAARVLYVSQPSLSHAVAALEAELGGALFHRLPHGTTPTAAGEALIVPARQVARDLSTAAATVREVLGLSGGRLDIVAQTTFAVDPLARLLGEFLRSHPNVTVQVTDPEQGTQVGQLVRSGDCELGLVNAAVPCAELESVLLAEQTLHLVLPPGHGWQRAVGLAELAELRFVATPQGTATRGVLDDALQQAGLAPTIAVETTHRAMIVPLVLEGAGAALLPKSMAENARVKGAVVVTTEPELGYRARTGVATRAAFACRREIRRTGPLRPHPPTITTTLSPHRTLAWDLSNSGLGPTRKPIPRRALACNCDQTQQSRALPVGVVCAPLRLRRRNRMSFAAESPRWLVSAGRIDEAAQVVEYTLGIPVTAAELSELAPEPGATRGSSTALFRGVYLRRTVFVVTFFTCAIIPLFALLTFGPKLLEALGFGSGNLSNLGTAIINLVFAIGCLLAMRLPESVGRRKTIVWSFALMVLPLLALGAWSHAPAAFVVAFFCLYALFCGGPGILECGYPNELFPTRIRAAAVGVAVALTRFAAATGTFLVLLSLSGLGTSATMYIGAGITFMGFLVCLGLAEDTGGLPALSDDPSKLGRVHARTVLS